MGSPSGASGVAVSPRTTWLGCAKSRQESRPRPWSGPGCEFFVASSAIGVSRLSRLGCSTVRLFPQDLWNPAALLRQLLAIWWPAALLGRLLVICMVALLMGTVLTVSSRTRGRCQTKPIVASASPVPPCPVWRGSTRLVMVPSALLP